MEANAMWWMLSGLLGIGIALGVLTRATRTRVRSVADRPDAVLPNDLVVVGQGTPEFGARLTLVQFSTTMCARCPSTARVLSQVSEQRDGVRHVEVDVTERDDLIRRFAILRTPTTLVLDASGRLRSRVSGPLSLGQATALRDEHLGESTPGADAADAAESAEAAGAAADRPQAIGARA